MAIRFGHISDMHLTADREAASIKMLLNAGGDPLHNTRTALQELQTEEIEFLLMTGDLCHEGSAEDYQALRTLLDEYLPNIPVLAAMGNHDIRENYRKGFLGLEEADDSPCCDVMEYGGYRFIAIDSAWEKLLQGGVSDEQYDWLESIAAQPVEKGNVLLTHHPFCPSLEMPGMPMSARLEAILRKYNFVCIFNGHVHRSCTGFAADVLHITGQSLAFDIEVRGATCYYTTRGGYNLCEIDQNGHFFADSRTVSPKGNIYQTKQADFWKK